MTDTNIMRHEYKELSEENKKAIQRVKDEGRNLYSFLGLLGESRELSLAKTKIEEAVMWATKYLTK